MSEQKVTLLLEPIAAVTLEAWETPPVTCPQCRGAGYHMPGLLKRERTVCAACGGSGRVKAEVTIRWKPYKENEDE